MALLSAMLQDDTTIRTGTKFYDFKQPGAVGRVRSSASLVVSRKRKGDLDKRYGYRARNFLPSIEGGEGARLWRGGEITDELAN